MPSEPKGQHFVPKCYLKQFIDPGDPKNPRVWIYSKDGKQKRWQKPDKTFISNHLYTFQIKDGKKDFSLEQSLSRIESKYSDLFTNKIAHKKPISPTEHIQLCMFVAAQLQRTLRYKRNQEGLIEKLIEHGAQLASAHGVVSEQVAEWRRLKTDIHKLHLADGVPDLANILRQMNVAFLFSRNPKKNWFITSDDPCTLFNPDLQWQRFYGPGFAQTNVQLTLPLSPEITVLFSWANFRGYCYVQNSVVQDLNRLTRAHADKEFVSPYSKTKWVWFMRFPLDLFFLFRVIKKESSALLHRMRLR